MKTIISFICGAIVGALTIAASYRYGFDRVFGLYAVIGFAVVLFACAISSFFIRPER